MKGSLKTTVQCSSHINYLELLAALFAFKALCTGLGGTHVKLQLDNITAVAYINNMGGTKSAKLNDLFPVDLCTAYCRKIKL